MKKKVYFFIALIAISIQAQKHTNIIIINADDLGWNDVNYLPNIKSPYYTPNIEALAKESMVFTDAYAAAPICSPTRASIVTGKTPGNIHLTAHVPGKLSMINSRTPKNTPVKQVESLFQLPLEEITFAEVLKKRGYRTAFMGKWHLAGADAVNHPENHGVINAEFHPEHQGFDINVGGCAYGSPVSWFAPYKNKMIADPKEGTYITDYFSEVSEKYIRAHKNEKFLLYLNPYAVHKPLKAPKDRITFIKDKIANPNNAVYAAMIYSLDLWVGNIMKTLKELNLLDNTLVIFTSDNGGLINNHPIRDLKGTLFEGGIRVPFIAHWPKRIKAGTICKTPVSSQDIFPTIVDACGFLKDVPKTVDGTSILPLFSEKQIKRKQPLTWHYPHFHHGGMASMDMGSVIREGDWKYVYLYKTETEYLYNVREDIAEKSNVIDANADKAKALKKQLFETLKNQQVLMPQKVAGVPVPKIDAHSSKHSSGGKKGKSGGKKGKKGLSTGSKSKKKKKKK